MLGIADEGGIPDAYQAEARLFHQAEGRWISPDPAGLGAVDLSNPQTWNRYAYVANDPLNNIDPSGTCPPGTVEGPNGDGCIAVNPSASSAFLGSCALAAQSGAVPPGCPALATSNSSNGAVGSGVAGAPPNRGCIAPSGVQRKLLPIQAASAKFWGVTLLAGVGVSGGAGLGKGIGIYGSASVQIAVSPNGNAAYAITFAAPAHITGTGTYAFVTPTTKGFGFLGGAQFGVSNVSDPSQLAGPGFDASGSLAAGIGIGGDASSGDGTWQLNVTLGFGLGGRGSAGANTYTAVVPICGSW